MFKMIILFGTLLVLLGLRGCLVSLEIKLLDGCFCCLSSLLIWVFVQISVEERGFGLKC